MVKTRKVQVFGDVNKTCSRYVGTLLGWSIERILTKDYYGNTVEDQYTVAIVESVDGSIALEHTAYIRMLLEEEKQDG